jgi:hypothetical protein
MTNAEKMVRELYENFPEASTGSALRCVGWKYEAFKFWFIDEEDAGKKYFVGITKAVAGFRKMVKAVQRGELKGLFLPAGFEYESGDWDAPAIDALAQFALFGEAIYG